jgi:hypothetical protein
MSSKSSRLAVIATLSIALAAPVMAAGAVDINELIVAAAIDPGVGCRAPLGSGAVRLYIAWRRTAPMDRSMASFELAVSGGASPRPVALYRREKLDADHQSELSR